MLLGDECGAAAEAVAVVAVSLRFARASLVLTEPGAAFAEAGLTLTGQTLVGGLEQMEGWGSDFSSVAPADFGSGWGRGRVTKGDRGTRSVLTANSHTVELMSCLIKSLDK